MQTSDSRPDSRTRELIRVSCPICDSASSRFERTVAGFSLERCQRCGFVYANPQYTPAALTDIYAHIATAGTIELYSCTASPTLIRGYHKKLEMIEKRQPKGRLLDFACGAGYFLEQALARGWDAHGVDLGEWTRVAAEARGVRNLHVGRLQDLQFPDGYFDVIHAAQVLEHLQRPREDLAEIHRILRPGGLLYIDVPNYRTLPTILGKDDFMLNEPPQHVNYFTPRSLRTLLDSSGFRSALITTEGGLKWENLLGRPTKGDLADVVRRRSTGSCSESNAHSRSGVGGGIKTAIKSVALACFVKPILYRYLKVGMLLVGLARRC
jgi:SAM-dependent methyltransferase